MTVKLIALLAASAAAIVAAAPAAAAKITYTYSSIFSGTNDGNPFTIGATFTGIGDTANTSTIFGYPTFPLSSFTAVADGPYVISTPFSFGVDAASGIAGFAVNGSNLFAFASPSFIGYDGGGDISATTTPFVTNASFATDRGNIVLTGQTNGSFSAVVDAATGAVPEPATWAMMIGGFGLMGGAMRRRRATRTTVRFA